MKTISAEQSEKPVKSQMAIRRGKEQRTFDILGVVLMLIMSVICLLPFIMLVSASFTDESYIVTHGYGIFPGEFSIEAYKTLFGHPLDILRAYGVTIFITIIGTGIALFITSMAAYVISRKDFKYRNKISFYFYFTTLFNGGMLSTYIFVVRYLGLKDHLAALILPYVVNVFYLLILKSFMSEVPMSIIESAKMDGANEFVVFIKLVLPLSKAGLATVGLFIALDYWNDWYNAMLYINTNTKYPLQYMLYNMLAAKQAMARLAAQAGIAAVKLPSNSLKMAMAVIATGPVILVYPFVQKYFVKGITIGAVKG